MDTIPRSGQGRAHGEEKRYATVAIWKFWQETKKARSHEGLTGLSFPTALGDLPPSQLENAGGISIVLPVSSFQVRRFPTI